MRALNGAHVTQDITVDQFDVVVINIIAIASSNLDVSYEEFPAEVKSHNKALHISMKCLDNVLVRFLFDIGPSLNFMPKSTLVKLSVNRNYIKLNVMLVKALMDQGDSSLGKWIYPSGWSSHL